MVYAGEWRVTNLKPAVYVETSVISFYFSTRPDPAMVARRDWTRAWWDQAGSSQRLFTSAAVLEELAQGEYPSRRECLELAGTLPVLDIDAEIVEIVRAYIAQRVMPADPAGDALHLAVASFHRCDFLVTWNCQHLANARKFRHVRVINTQLGLFVPTLVTPLELYEGANDE